MTDALVSALRQRSQPGFDRVNNCYSPEPDTLCHDAADAIDRLTRERDEWERRHYDTEVRAETAEAALSAARAERDTQINERVSERLAQKEQEILAIRQAHEQRLGELESDLAEHKATFDLRWKADMRAIKRWQEATGRKLEWPDRSDDLERSAENIAGMVADWVEGGIRQGGDWRNGLAGIIARRLKRLDDMGRLPEAPAPVAVTDEMVERARGTLESKLDVFVSLDAVSAALHAALSGRESK